MPKQTNYWNEFDILRALVIVSIVIYILGIVPKLTQSVKALFSNPLMKVVFISLIVFVGYLDSTIGTLLAVAFIVSYLETPDYKYSSLGGLVGNIQAGSQKLVGGVGTGATELVRGVGTGATELVGGVGTGATELVRGVGTGATELVRGVGGATDELIGGLQSGSQRFASGLGSGTHQMLDGAQDLVGGASEGVQHITAGLSEGAQQLLGGAGEIVDSTAGGVYQVLGGFGRGTQRLVSGVQSGTADLIGGVQSGTQSAIQGLQSGVKHVVSPEMAEGMQNAPLSVSQAYQKHVETESNGSCNVSPQMTTGCDPIVGYNAPYNCGCSGDCGGKCSGLDPACLCKGVQVWKDELNAQGLNHPIGYAGGQVGSTF